MPDLRSAWRVGGRHASRPYRAAPEGWQRRTVEPATAWRQVPRSQDGRREPAPEPWRVRSRYATEPAVRGVRDVSKAKAVEARIGIDLTRTEAELIRRAIDKADGDTAARLRERLDMILKAVTPGGGK